MGHFVVEADTAPNTTQVLSDIVEDQVLAFPAKGDVESFLVSVFILVRVRFVVRQFVELNLLESVDEGLHKTHPVGDVGVVPHVRHLDRCEESLLHAGVRGVRHAPSTTHKGFGIRLETGQIHVGGGQGDGVQPHFPSRPRQSHHVGQPNLVTVAPVVGKLALAAGTGKGDVKVTHISDAR